MKKILLAFLCTLSVISNVQAQNRTCEASNSELLFASSLRYNNLVEEEKVLQTGCIEPTKKIMYMIVNQAKTVESVLLAEKYLKNMEFRDFQSNNNTDWFSTLLKKDIVKQRFANIYESEEKETQAIISQHLGTNKFNYNWKPSAEESSRLLNYIGQKYKREYTFYKDDYDNFALIYMIVSNKPDLFNYAYGAYQDKNIWIKENKEKYSPLHFVFSPLLKGKDTTKMNDRILKEVPVAYMINVPHLSLKEGRVYDYFQFAELMKDNNPDFYKKLKAKYKFQIQSLYNTPEIVKLINNSLALSQLKN